MIEKLNFINVHKTNNGKIAYFEATNKKKLEQAIESVKLYLNENHDSNGYDLKCNGCILFITRSSAIEEVIDQYEDYLRFIKS